MVRMPGASYALGLDPLTDDERGIADAMRRDVVKLAEEIGERNVAHPRGLAAAADFIASSFGAAGLATKRAAFVTSGVTCENVAGEIAGGASKDDIVVIGAHYDSVEGTVGANDNASGVAALLSLARALATSKPARTLRFVAFANEEPPWFQTPNMGSLVYARACRERGDRIVAMLSLETIGYYSSVSGSQRYPFPLSLVYPSTGDFIAFVGDLGSRALVREAIDVFRQTTHFPSEGGALPGWIPGIGWSDHWSFWQAGYPAIMVTDTAPFRYPHYHTTRDTPDQLDYERTARVVRGLERVVAALARC
ncbi:MAG: M28 family peptidase [Planctomycetes bacterium]|nr:M28 family peptidase [Planctomycetota bacterium]MBI3847929.1 M28 family peptidase [Planctomycetota bacterium]